MWPDEEGEEPEGGEFPDPSTRQWRHPSEIAAENARAAAAAAAASGGPGATPVLSGVPSSSSILWPITVVGGCIAVAAFGVFGLYLTGTSTNREFITSAATTIGENGRSTAGNNGEAEGPQFDVPRSESLGSDAGDVTGDAGSAADSSVDGAPTTTTSTASTTTVAPVPAQPTLPNQPNPLVGPALYLSADLEPGPIAAVAVVDQLLITSAGAVAGNAKLSLRVGGTWIDATVEFIDPVSDVAVVVPTVPVEDLDIPRAEVGERVKPGAEVYVGYCQSDTEPAPPSPIEPGCNQNSAATDGADSAAGADLGDNESEAAEESDRAESSGRRRELGEPDDSGWGAAPESQPWTPNRVLPTEPEDRESSDDDDDDGRVPKGEKRQAMPKGAKDPRAGTVYSTSQILRTVANHLIYDPIRTQIPAGHGLAGSPLRDRDGRIVGIVVHSASPSISALPIDRAMTVARSLVETGLGSPAWLGIEGRSTVRGVEVTAVDQNGPAFDRIRPGDLLDTLQGKRLTEVDHLIHVVRKAGPGGEIVVWVNRDGVRFRVDLAVASRLN